MHLGESAMRNTGEGLKQALRKNFLDRGVSRVKTCGWPAYLLKSGEDLGVTFADSISRAHGGCVLSGIISLYSAEFEREIAGHPLSEKKTFYMGAALENFPMIFHPPIVVRDYEDVAPAVSLVIEGVQQLSSTISLTIDDLLKRRNEGRLFGIPFEFFETKSGKTDLFFDWAKLRSGR